VNSLPPSPPENTTVFIFGIFIWNLIISSPNYRIGATLFEPSEANYLDLLQELAGFDEARSEAIFTPFGAGCSVIVQYHYLEKDSDLPRSVIGMFDISARPYVQEDILSFATPMKKIIFGGFLLYEITLKPWLH
jgi:hypothetical protein